MMLDELIESLWELKRAYGEQEVKLLTQKDDWSWGEHYIDEVYFSEDDRAVVIEGKDKTKSKEQKANKFVFNPKKFLDFLSDLHYNNKHKAKI